MKEWECVEVDHHKKVAEVIEEYQKKGWRLHTYQATYKQYGALISHYLLFERGS